MGHIGLSLLDDRGRSSLSGDHLERKGEGEGKGKGNEGEGGREVKGRGKEGRRKSALDDSLGLGGCAFNHQRPKRSRGKNIWMILEIKLSKDKRVLGKIFRLRKR